MSAVPSDIQAIIDKAAAAQGLSVREFLTARPRPLAHLRQDAMLAVREIARPLRPYEIGKPYSHPQIGQAFGGRDHTTVMHAVKSALARRAETQEKETTE